MIAAAYTESKVENAFCVGKFIFADKKHTNNNSNNNNTHKHAHTNARERARAHTHTHTHTPPSPSAYLRSKRLLNVEIADGTNGHGHHVIS